MIWGKSYIPELQKLSGRLGGHALFRKYSEEINSDCFVLDLDNQDSLDLWVKREENSALRNLYS